MAQECETYTDKTGEQIEFKVILAGEHGLLITAQHQQYGRVGCATITKLGDASWQVDDIRIEERVPVRAWYQWRIGGVNYGGQPHMISYRNRGIGTALMNFLKRFAQQQGVQEIVGVVSHQGAGNTARLLAWYRKQGFRISPSALGRDKAEVTKLVWRAPPAQHHLPTRNCAAR